MTFAWSLDSNHPLLIPYYWAMLKQFHVGWICFNITREASFICFIMCYEIYFFSLPFALYYPDFLAPCRIVTKIYSLMHRKTERSYRELEARRTRFRQLEKIYLDMTMQKELQVLTFYVPYYEPVLSLTFLEC